MRTEDIVESTAATDENNLSTRPPLLWPNPRCHVDNARYAVHPPFKKVINSSDLVAGVLVGATENTLRLLHELLTQHGSCRVLLVVVVFPAGPTRESHLTDLKELAERCASKD